MLHICTPLYRYDNLRDIYHSIPKEEDIVWHIASSFVSRPPIIWFPDDDRVKLYSLKVPDNNVIAKRNHIFDNIHDGWFHLLDDDTYFHKGMYEVYKRTKKENYVGMVNGRQTLPNGRTRLIALSVPKLTGIDTGNVLCHHSVLRSVKWAFDEKDPTIPKDYVFWKNVYDYFGKVKMVSDVVSVYNGLR
jgi:hypothetical protein